ncbi:MAG: hypothetical protein NDF55_05005 [archaeon GB-1867-005]|nr:hypothetical protein [Candidatus Culexmicrobium cathedralense]
MKKKYRSRLQIMADILKTIRDEGGRAGITRILYGANLSYDRLTRYLKELSEAKLLREMEESGKTIFVLTERGYEFLKEYRRIKEFAEAFGIKI